MLVASRSFGSAGISKADGIPGSPYGGLLPLHFVELFHATPEVGIFAVESGVQVGFENILGEQGSDDPCAHAEHVHIIVFHTLVRAIGVVTERSAHAVYLVYRNGGANSCTADHDSPLASSGKDFIAELLGDIGKIDGSRAVRADVFHVVAPGLKNLNERPLQRKSSVIGPDDEVPLNGSICGGKWGGRNQGHGGRTTEKASTSEDAAVHFDLEEFDFVTQDSPFPFRTLSVSPAHSNVDPRAGGASGVTSAAAPDAT